MLRSAQCYRRQFLVLIETKSLVPKTMDLAAVFTKPTSTLKVHALLDFVIRALSLLFEVKPKLIEVPAVIEVSVTGPKSREQKNKTHENTHGATPL